MTEVLWTAAKECGLAALAAVAFIVVTLIWAIGHLRPGPPLPRVCCACDKEDSCSGT